MPSRVRVLFLTIAIVVFAASAGAEVLCRTRSGTVKIRDACRKKETPVDLAQIGVAPPDTPDQVRAKFFAGTACPGNDPADVMVRVGGLCVDVFEASVWSEPAGGTQFGVENADYPCQIDGDDCTAIYARSVASVLPARYITWFQAQQACRNAGKRLLTNAEWQSAAAGTPDPGPAGDGLTTCNTNTTAPKVTGSSATCVSAAGVRDMVGNVWEWVAEWEQAGISCTDWGAFSDDAMCLSLLQTSGAGIALDPPGGPARGGNWDYRNAAGVFAVDASVDVTSPYVSYGFRCTR
jgi:formylglycine-generating enzyme required for sulfatase activity